MKAQEKKYTEDDLKRAFNAGQELDADYTLACRWKFMDYQHYKKFLRIGNKVGGFYQRHG